jgi:hypothetical protein
MQNIWHVLSYSESKESNCRFPTEEDAFPLTPSNALLKYLQCSADVMTCALQVAFAAGRPFTEDIAKENVAEEQWGKDLFKHINLILTSMWIIIFLIQFISYLVGFLCSAWQA